MADSLSASPSNPVVKKIADFLRFIQQEDKPEFLPTQASPFSLAAKYLLPQSTTVENIAYGNLPMAMPPSGTGGLIPITKTGRKGELADIVGFALGGVPGTKVAGEAVTTGANKLADILTQAVTRNPEATAPAALQAAGQMTPLSRIFIGPKSAAWDKAAAEKAIELEKAGAQPKDIWEQTGTVRGLDKQWRQEISDIGAQLDMSKIPPRKMVSEIMDDVLAEQGIKVDPNKSLSSQIGNEKYDEIYRIALDRSLEQKRSVRLPYAFKHDALEEAYPNLINNLQVERELGSAKGSYNPTTKTVSTSSGKGMFGESPSPEQLNADARSTLLHEIQHAIQELEGWGRGGSPESAKAIASAQIRAETAPLVEPFAKNQHYWGEYGKAARSEYMIRLGDIAQRESIKPRIIYKLNDWYKYGNDYRQIAGPQPKKPGEARDAWFRGAADYIRQQNLMTNPRYQGLPYDNLRDAKNAQKRAMTQIKKTDEAAQQYRELGQKQKRFSELSDFEVYRRLAGEAESRLTQAREGLTMEQRRANYPFAERYEKPFYGTSDNPAPYGAKTIVNQFGLDVPVKETIAYTQFNQGYQKNDPLMQFLGITALSNDPLEMFVGTLGK